MISSIESYVDALRQELRGADRALIQDAVADAREYLSNALAADSGRKTNDESLQAAIVAFGTPAEVALAYREVERRVPVGIAAGPASSALHRRFLAVYRDTRAWGALLYMVICVLLGMGYLLWTFFGVGFSLMFSILVIGLPLALAFLFSVRGIALLEGRLIEGLLGVRMPRRRVFFPRQTRWLDQLKSLLADKHTWLTLVYTSTLWIVGYAYLFLLVLGVGGSLLLMASPVLQEWTGEAIISIGEPIFVPRWLYPVPVASGFIILTAFLHLTRVVGRVHARIAKAMLIGETPGR